MSKSKTGPEVERERPAENVNHKARREQKRKQAELARIAQDDEGYEELLDEEIETFQKLKKGRR